jgi:hypothetical protein
MFCKNCLKNLRETLTKEDILILMELKNSTTIYHCKSIDEFELELNKTNIKKSLIKLNNLTLIMSQRIEGKNKYFLSKDGIKILKISEVK